jgi:4-amino-4-deoxy-L-arabinose transferase-like glycosyltransferase
MNGTIHPYYTVALAPAIAAIVGIGGVALWAVRDRWIGRIGLAGMVLSTSAWAYELLLETPGWLPVLRYVVLVAGLLASLGLVLPALLAPGTALSRRVGSIALAVGLVAGLVGPISYAIATASVAHSGSIPSVGATSASVGGGMGGGFGADTSSSSSNELTTLLQSTNARWAAATDGSQSAATFELSTDTAVMAIGGWSSDPYPTLAQFQAYVAAGDVGYYISSGQGSGGGGRGGDSTSSAIATWVAANYDATTVGGYTVYDLSS